MKQKQRIAFLFLCMVAVALILGACDSDSGNNGSEMVGDSSSSVECTNTYGTNTVTDCRDGQTYRTAMIGTQTWMAENLNYADSVSMTNLKGNSWCYDNSADSCAKYGRLYTWTAAMNIASSYQSTTACAVISTPHQGACPAGWHIPTSAEWISLENYVGGFRTAGTYLKATSGWTSYSGISNLDSYGFSALPGGYHSGSDFGLVGYNGIWWTAMGHSSTFAYSQLMSYSRTLVYESYNDKTYGRSLRCLKD